ncbi:MAG: M28 family peptidase [Anaerolineales bacterium]
MSWWHKEYLLLALIALLLVGGYLWKRSRQEMPRFDGARAFAYVERQVALGPRTPGSQAQAQVLEWMREELRRYGWQVELQEGSVRGHVIRNLIAFRQPEPPRWLLGAHYDSRLLADRDPDPTLRTLPVPGANDGASGVAVLLELARVLPSDLSVWLVFFDAEDQGHIPGWEEWSLGARYFVQTMPFRPEGVIIVDMVGDADLDLPMDANSDPALRESIWQVAGELGYGEIFRPQVAYAVIDDHIPFLEAGIPAVDIIDLNYAFWHTTQDTPDKVSPRSLEIVGQTLLIWLTQQKR